MRAASPGFCRAVRLLTPAQYAEVFAARKSLRGERFVLHYRVNGLESARLGLVIPKKQAQAAVLRNAVKRQARELFRQRRAALPAADIVLRLAAPLGRGKPLAESTDRDSRADWRREVGDLLTQLGRRLPV